jgi:hypothetical protein
MDQDKNVYKKSPFAIETVLFLQQDYFWKYVLTTFGIVFVLCATVSIPSRGDSSTCIGKWHKYYMLA